mgnify:CR=1 FL=1
MDAAENELATAQDLVTYAQQQGVDLETLRNDSLFQKGQRWVILWRKLDGLPCSGPLDEQEGTLHYNMQGTVTKLPNSLQQSASAFRGAWTEAGTLDSLERAFELVKAWLLDGKEVDDLPQRGVSRYGIG